MRITHYVHQIGPTSLLCLVLEDEVRVQEPSVPSSKAASDCDRISVKPELGATIFLSIGVTGGPLCESAAFTGIVVVFFFFFFFFFQRWPV